MRALLFLAFFSLPAFASGTKLLDLACTPAEGGDAYQLTYWSTTTPGGSVSYSLELVRAGKQARIAITRRPQLTKDAILLIGKQMGDESEISGHAVLYARNNVTFLDVQLSGEAAALNTTAPIDLLCRAAEQSPRH